MEKVLLFHAHRYPLIQPIDAVKLIYQCEFGIGHLIENTELFQKRLQDEIDSLEIHAEIPLTESIGNGIIRVMLNSEDFRQINKDSLISACIKTAETVHGSIAHFRKQLDLLKNLSGKGTFSFSAEELAEYLTDYERNGYPPISHSQIYHQTYHPSYRVIKESFL